MLGNNYLLINGTPVPNPRGEPKWSNKPSEKVITSEAGTDILIQKRALKRTATFEFHVTSKWRDRLMNYCLQPTVWLTYRGQIIEGRLRVADETLVEGSEYVEGTDGLYRFKANFTEV